MEREKYLSNNYTYPEEFEIVEWSAGFPRVSINPRIVVVFNYRDRFRFVGRLLFEPRTWPRNSCNFQVRRLNDYLPSFFSLSFLFFFNFSYILYIYLETYSGEFSKEIYIYIYKYILQLETTAEGWGDEIESQQATSGAIERRVGHFGLVAPVRAKYPQQAGQTQHPQTQRQLSSDEELFSR